LNFNHKPFSYFGNWQHNEDYNFLNVLFNDAVNCRDYTTQGTDKQLSRKHRKNDTDSGKPKYMDRNLSQCHFANKKPHMVSPEIKPRLPW
jgi:hypothetical protein